MITSLCRERAVVDRHELVCLCSWNHLEPASNVDPLLPSFLEYGPEKAPHPGLLRVVCTHTARVLHPARSRRASTMSYNDALVGCGKC